nr:unnamed protein product [Digitaria exilis]
MRVGTAEEREKLSSISMRTKAAKAKIKVLSHSEEPLTIVSPAQHPSCSTKQEDYRPLFHDKYGSPIATVAVNGGFNREYGLEGTLELFQFFSEENCDYPSKPPEVGGEGAANNKQPGPLPFLGRGVRACFPAGAVGRFHQAMLLVLLARGGGRMAVGRWRSSRRRG